VPALPTSGRSGLHIELVPDATATIFGLEVLSRIDDALIEQARRRYEDRFETERTP
jgi:hypothetical protein